MANQRNNPTTDKAKPMTPEKIVKLILSEVVPDYTPYHYENTEQIGIEAIKQYAREMCEKQKLECALQWCGAGSDEVQLNIDSILDAPYPKELE